MTTYYTVNWIGEKELLQFMPDLYNEDITNDVILAK